MRPEGWWEKGNRGADGSDDDMAALNDIGRIGDDAELLRPDIYAEITRRSNYLLIVPNILSVCSDCNISVKGNIARNW